MPTIAIALKDIVVDPQRSVDLSALSQDEAIAQIKKSYGFLSSSIDVTIQEGIAIITLPEGKAEEAAQALKTYARAVRAAERGEYARSIPLFKKVLEALPAHIDARRNLAMSYLESGDKEQAKDYLVETLMLDPNDAWSYVLLGNIYSKHENNFDRAEKLYRRAMEINPSDALLLTNYGALMVERGNAEQAAEFFERAIQENPAYPNPYYALALLSMQERRPAEALASLDDLFNRGKPVDVRSGPLYAEARRLYLDANQALATLTTREMMDTVEQRKKALEDEGNIPIRITWDNSLDVPATAQLAWKRARDHHAIKYRDRPTATTPHLLAHELEHLAMEMDARAAGRNRPFTTTAATREYAIRSVSDHVSRLERMGLPDEGVTQYILFVVNGLALQLYNTPLDMIIEKRLFERDGSLHPSQFVSLYALEQENVRALTDPEIKRMSPYEIWRANVTLNCAMALFLDHLYQGRTTYSEPYRQHNVFRTGQRLFRMWQDSVRNFRPGDEYDLVDEYARILRLQRWYEWGSDLVAWIPGKEEDVGTRREGTTNPELLKEKEPASVMYCLDALQRFDAMGDSEILQIASEIALLGRAGLDYASSDKKYVLNSLPGERFSGLQLMCLMYVAFQRIDPTLDTGMDLHDAYRAALALHRSRG